MAFDGLWPTECMLVEAKGMYAQFLDPKKGKVIRNIIFGDLFKESISHKEVVRQVKKARFCWFFLENEAKEFFDDLVHKTVPTVFKPM